jgi:hypothetical protein
MNSKAIALAVTAVSIATLSQPAKTFATWLHAFPADHTAVHRSFTFHWGTSRFKTTSGRIIHCSTSTGTGTRSTSTGGSVSIKLHSCKDQSLGISCTSAGQPSGTISAAGVFHLIMLGSNSPGILITPAAGATEVTPGKALFSEFSCFGVNMKIFGKGVIGTITTPACGASSTTSNVSFQESATGGHQKHLTWTGSTYDFEATVGGGEHVTTSFEAAGTITYPDSQTLTCT